jgi:phytoene dehydrogenase-like protein
MAHPLPDGTAAILANTLEETAESLGADSQRFLKTLKPLHKDWRKLLHELLAPLHLPRHPFLVARFGMLGRKSAAALTSGYFREKQTQALIAGLAAHSALPLTDQFTASFALVLGLSAFGSGWPFPRGGARKIADALANIVRENGGKIVTGEIVKDVNELPKAGAYLLDLSPKSILNIAGNRFHAKYRRKLEQFRYGPGSFKVDWALSDPIPFSSEQCRRAGTLHLGGCFAEIAESEQSVWNGIHPEKPFVILAQHTAFDPERAPEGKHTAWGYCHVPKGSNLDITDRIERQIERYAPGFKDCILSRHVMNPAGLEEYNPNYVGGDINGGVQDWRQLFARPVSLISPYTTPDRRIYICSSSTPPGGGVHGMCGYHAARIALNRTFGIKSAQ